MTLPRPTPSQATETAAPHGMPVTWPSAQRQAAFDAWLAALTPAHRLMPGTLRSASSDASFRRYLRIDNEAGGSFIMMDAPPPMEDVRPFVQVASLIAQAGLHAPAVLAQDLEQGFLLLTDMGSALMLTRLQQQREQGHQAQNEALMRQAVQTLVAWQGQVDANGLPAYDDALLRRELALFPEWCVAKEFGVSWNDEEQQQWKDACDLLVASALAQPTVAVHRDYMPRNLMVTPEGLGLLDFQDAVRGPITYDMASLIRDAFFSWDEEQELDFAVRYWQAARKAGLPVDEDFGELWRALEWMGLQRHLKVLGIFCRLKHRDAKPHYSEDLPRFFAYAHKVADRYNGLRPLARLLEPLMGATRVEAFY
jgi:aminoglycoside/choline kinase family phosphotransferase